MKTLKDILEGIKSHDFSALSHEKESKSKVQKKICFQREPEKSRLKKVLRELTPEYKIRFYDDDPDTFDEEGGYCHAIILDQDTALIMESNHDWCKEWETIPIDELVEFMQYNWGADDIWGKYKNYFILEENKYYNLITMPGVMAQKTAV